MVMKQSEIYYNNWATLNCDRCDQHHYVYEKGSKRIDCECGNTDGEFLAINEWDALDYLKVCSMELKNNGMEKYVASIDSLYDSLKADIANQESFNKFFHHVANEVFKLIHPD
jgi:hypothetical protein